MEHRSVYDLLTSVASANADRVAFRYKTGGEWHDVSWSEHEGSIRAIAKALMALDVAKGDRVCILSQTRLEWVQTDIGIGTCGALTVGIYASNLPEDCAYVINHSEAEVIFVENQEQLDKILSVRDRIPGMRKIIRFEGPGDPGRDVLSWREFLEAGEDVDDARLEERAARIEPDDTASLVYTSGTTGAPKGAMITHRNLLFTAESARDSLYIEREFITLLFLPLAHVFARLIVYLGMRCAIPIAFAESIQQVPENLKEIQPHFIASVPRIFEKIHLKILSDVEDAGGLKKRVFDWALGVGRRVSLLKQQKKRVPILLTSKSLLANRLVFHKIHAAFGGRLVYAVSGAAPLNKDIAEFFHACGVLILEGIGMTENTSFSNVNRYDNNRFGTVGHLGPGIEMKLGEDGEILFRGPNVMKGYFKDPEATAETIDDEGWLHSGDIGHIDPEGFLKVTDRKKDLIVTAGGKNVAPQRVEKTLRTSRYVSQVVAIGDRRKFISALVTLDSMHVRAWADEHGISLEGEQDLSSHPEIRSLIRREVEDKNRQLASFESVKQFRILPEDLSIEAGELTPTLKVKRKVVLEKYRRLVEEMYDE